MKLVTDKTQLVVMRPKHLRNSVTENIYVNDTSIHESSSAEHLGLIRSSSMSNLHSIQDRIAKHLKSIFLVQSCGSARSHFANPAASLKIESVLFISNFVFWYCLSCPQ